ncbi:glycine zipper family protein [Chryseobacterium cheonjiense]|uniref:Glycine zipper family protein n=1 Tax=Chryseobacterium cheonjiense TaxID=2728845 RepID=A0A7Y0A7T4_9FLAO|nr:glycine zipper family protein [Chryseobacterium cheonjiense]NML58297.1 glycine zipper family protein [Chryseobacterium cheonjiense]
MKKLILFFLFSVSLSAQKIETIEFKENIKDRKALTKSLTLIDGRKDKVIGKISNKKGEAEIRLPDEDLKNLIESWFVEDNKTTGNKDIVLYLEELKVYDEQAQNDKEKYSKAKIKISSFLKRNDNYYFINRFDNVIVCDPKRTSTASKYLSLTIAEIIAEFIKSSYTNTVSGQYIPENDIANYDSYIDKNNKSLNEKLKDGVYLNFKSFTEQKPAEGYFFEKNKKGNVVRIKNKEDLAISINDTFSYVDGGVAYITTPDGFKEMKKDGKGYYIIASRTQLFTQKNGNGVLIGAVAGGLVGAAIGAAIDSGSHKAAVNGKGFKSPAMGKVYIDSLTGNFSFQ